MNGVAEEAVGITEFATPGLRGFSAILKHRYRDFQVNEVDAQGQVALLTSLDPPPAREHVTPEGLAATLPDAVQSFHDVAGPDAAQRLRALLEAVVATATAAKPNPAAEGDAAEAAAAAPPLPPGVQREAGSHALSVVLPAMASKEQRTAVHQFFKGNALLPPLATRTVDDAEEAPSSVAGEQQAQKEQRGRQGQQKEQQGGKAAHIKVVWQPAGGAGGRGGTAPVEGAGGGGRGGGRAGGRGQGRGGRGGGAAQQEEQAWGGGPGERFIKFVLYKENMDTQLALGTLAKALRLGARTRIWGYAGTKDKRGVTTQFVTAYRLHPATLATVNSAHWVRGIKVGSFSYTSQELQLGSLLGNRFQVLMRDCRPDQDAAQEAGGNAGQHGADGGAELERQLTEACEALGRRGFINYFGLQRFGTAGCPTHMVGTALLQGRFRHAVDLIMGRPPPLASGAPPPAGSSGHQQQQRQQQGGRQGRGQQQQQQAGGGAALGMRPEVEAARRAWALLRDAKTAARSLPPWMVSERAVMSALAQLQGAAPANAAKQARPAPTQPTADATGAAAPEPASTAPLAEHPEPAAKKPRLEPAAAEGGEPKPLPGGAAAGGAEGGAVPAAADVAEEQQPRAKEEEGAVPWPAWLTERRAAEAILQAPRTLRMMYLHAWQSHLWNLAATHRVQRYGADRVVAGDLVIPRHPTPAQQQQQQQQQVAGAGGTVAAAAAEELAALAGGGGGEDEDEQAVAGDQGGAGGGAAAESTTEGGKAEGGAAQQQQEAAAVRTQARLGQAHVVTAEEAAAGVFAVEDVVLPLPGTRVQYPRHATGRLYRRLCAVLGVRVDLGAEVQGDEEEEEEEHVMEVEVEGAAGAAAPAWAQQLSFSSLTGDYRRLVLRPRGFSFRLLRYSDVNDDTLVRTGLELLQQAQRGHGASSSAAAAGGPGGPLLGLLLDFTLPSSAYATMLIRELTRQGTSRAFQSALTQAAQERASAAVAQ